MPYYARLFVEPGPLPPHERSWRHPSELVSTATPVDASRHIWAPTLVAATMAVVVVATAVLTIAPRPSNAPSALDATTLPPFVTAVRVPEPTAVTASPVAESPIQLASAIALPREVAVPPTQGTSAVAADSPSPAETVIVVTEDALFRVAWHDVAFCGVDDGVVVNLDGELVARITNGSIAPFDGGPGSGE